MLKKIFIDSYVRADGTPVKGYYKTVETNGEEINSGFVSENMGIEPFESPKSAKSWLPDGEKEHRPIIFSANDVPVLRGGVSIDVDASGNSKTGSNVGEVIGTVGNIVGEVISIAMQAYLAYQAMQAANTEAIKYIQPQIDTQIKRLDTHVKSTHNNGDNLAKNLTKIKDPAEYLKGYKKLQNEHQKYQKIKTTVDRLKAHANNRNYHQLAQEAETLSTAPVSNKIQHANLTEMINDFNKVTGKKFVNDGAEFWNASIKNLKTDYINNNSKIISHIDNLPSKNIANTVINKLHSQNLDTNTKANKNPSARECSPQTFFANPTTKN